MASRAAPAEKACRLGRVPRRARAGPAVWFWIVAETGAEEAWDEDLWWLAMLGAALVLGLLLGSSGLPYVDEPAPLAGFLIAALLFVSQVPCAVVTSSSAGVSFLPLTLVVFLPLGTALFGAAASAGVLANRGLRRRASTRRSAKVKS